MIKQFKINNEEEAQQLDKDYNDFLDNINKKKYMSVLEERKRLNKINIVSKIKRPLCEVFNAFLVISLEDMNPNLSIGDLEEGYWYKSSKKNNNVKFKLNKFIPNKEIQLTWIANNQIFIKTVTFYSSRDDSFTKIRYSDYVKGDTSIMGFFERHILSVYVKRQKLAFHIQILKTKLKLNMVSEENEHKVLKKIERLLSFSKSLS